MADKVDGRGQGGQGREDSVVPRKDEVRELKAEVDRLTALLEASSRSGDGIPAPASAGIPPSADPPASESGKRSRRTQQKACGVCGQEGHDRRGCSNSRGTLSEDGQLIESARAALGNISRKALAAFLDVRPTVLWDANRIQLPTTVRDSLKEIIAGAGKPNAEVPKPSGIWLRSLRQRHEDGV